MITNCISRIINALRARATLSKVEGEREAADFEGGNKKPFLSYRLTSAKLYSNFIVLELGLQYLFSVNWGDYG